MLAFKPGKAPVFHSLTFTSPLEAQVWFDLPMQWVWLIPSLAYGIYSFVSTGQVYGLIFGLFSALAMVGGSIMQSRKEPIDLKQPVRFGHKRVAIGNSMLPRLQFFWQAAWVTRVYQDLQEQNQRHNANLALRNRVGGSLAVGSARLGGLQAWLGFSGTTEVQIDLSDEGVHALIMGATGSGKSQLLSTWLVSLCQTYSPEDLQIILLDYKGGAALSPFVDTPWSAGLFTDIDAEAPAALQIVGEELHRRERLLAECKVGRVQDLPSGRRVPMLVLAVDEVQAVLLDAKTHQHFESLAARGRSLGIHLILTAQSLAGIPRALMPNLGVRIAVGKCDVVDLAQLGFVRQPQSDPSTAAVPGQESRFENLQDWGQAMLITPNRQLRFAFPSRGVVGAARLQPKPQEISQKDFLPLGGQNGPSNTVFDADSVAPALKQFVFGLGLQNPPQ
jgi:hypothetical protein